MVTGVFIFIGLLVNRADRLKSHEKEKTSKSEIEKLNHRLNPRRIDLKKRESLIAALKLIPDKRKIFITASVLDDEAMTLAEDIEAVLLASDFEVYLPKGIQADSAIMVGPAGTHIVLKDPRSPNPLAINLHRCFKEAGIILLGLASSNPDFETDRIEITIGQR